MPCQLHGRNLAFIYCPSLDLCFKKKTNLLSVLRLRPSLPSPGPPCAPFQPAAAVSPEVLEVQPVAHGALGAARLAAAQVGRGVAGRGGQGAGQRPTINLHSQGKPLTLFLLPGVSGLHFLYRLGKEALLFPSFLFLEMRK